MVDIVETSQSRLEYVRQVAQPNEGESQPAHVRRIKKCLTTEEIQEEVTRQVKEWRTFGSALWRDNKQELPTLYSPWWDERREVEWQHLLDFIPVIKHVPPVLSIPKFWNYRRFVYKVPLEEWADVKSLEEEAIEWKESVAEQDRAWAEVNKNWKDSMRQLKRQNKQKVRAFKAQERKDERDRRNEIRRDRRFGDPLHRALYSSPPALAVEWNALDDLTEDLMLETKYGTLEHNLPFIDYIQDFLFVSKKQEDKEISNYTFDDYKKAYDIRATTSSFYNKKAAPLSESLQYIPVYTIVNSLNQIMTLHTIPTGINMGWQNVIGDTFHNLAHKGVGVLTNPVHGNDVGLFFLSLDDAQVCMDELMGTHEAFRGIQKVGASIQCIGLDAAYKITREFHPGIDFRLVPDYSEVTNLLSNHVGEANMVMEDGQQQLRFRRRPVSVRMPKKLAEKLEYAEIDEETGEFVPSDRIPDKPQMDISPFTSFLHNNEYFKGVPIYIVQSKDKARSIPVEILFRTTSQIDAICGGFVNWIDKKLGHGHNWVMQGSLLDIGQSEQFKTYIFFTREQAVKFTNSLGRKAARHPFARCTGFKGVVRKPKIFVYNFQDFIERWEDALIDDSSPEAKRVLNGMYNSDRIQFIPPTQVELDTTPELTWLEKYKESMDIRLHRLWLVIQLLFELPEVADMTFY